MKEAGSDGPRRVVVCNPVSGSEDHAAHVQGLADEYGFEVRELAPWVSTERAIPS